MYVYILIVWVGEKQYREELIMYINIIVVTFRAKSI
jgi:hypothetical protein